MVQEYAVFAKHLICPKLRNGRKLLVIALHLAENGKLELILEEVRKCNHRLADFKRVSEYCLHNFDFPRTASLKLKREQLAKDILSKQTAIFQINKI